MYHFLDQQGNIDTVREEAYRTAIESQSRPYDTVTGLITFSDATTMEIDGTCLPTNAIRISRQCVDDNELMFGGVFTDTLKLSVIPDNSHQDRYLFFGAKIELFYEIDVEIEEQGEVVIETEQVPLGVFYVADAEKMSDTVNITAYDSITLLDKELGDAQVTGNPWAVFNLISSVCQYPLAFAEQDLEEFVNYTYSIQASKLDGLNTYRDVVKQLCQLLGCFALDDRTGRLKLKKFSHIPDLVLGNNETGDYPWYTFVPADYQCAYVGVSITSISGTYSKMAENPSIIGSIMIIEDAPAWDLGTEEANQAKTDNIYGLLYNDLLESPVLMYTPANCDMPSDATYECGDMIEFSTNRGNYVLIITNLEWKFHNGMSLESVGINPYLESSSNLSEEGGRILSQAVTKSRLQFLTFTNSEDVVLDKVNSDKKLGTCSFRPTTQTSALFIATILVDVSVADIEETETTQETENVEVPVYAYNDQSEVVPLVDADGNPVDHLTAIGTNTFTYNYTYARDGRKQISIYYKMRGIKVPNDTDPYIAIDEIEKGKHIITVSYTLFLDEPHIMYDFDIYISANIGNTNDTVTIPALSMQATLVGQEIDEIARWDGNIRVDDEQPFELIELGNMLVKDITHGEFVVSINPETYDPTLPNQLYIRDGIIIPDPNDPIVEDFVLLALDAMSVKTIADGTGQLIPHILFYSVYISTENDDTLITEDGIAFETEGMPDAT